jgi:hypothetical protein
LIELMSSNDKVNSVNKVKKLPAEAKDVTNITHPVLCGGTFLTLILQSRKPTASRRERTQGTLDIFREPDVLFGLIKIVQPDYIRPAGNTFKTYTTYYKRCTEHTPNDLKFENESVISAFLVRLETDYAAELTKMAAFINQYIDVGTTAQNDVLLVKRLIELIRDDESIPAMTQFAVCKDGSLVDKRGLVGVTEVYLPAFLLSVWKFIVTERKDNSIGAETISTWQHPTAQGRYAGIDGSTIKQNIKVVCDVIVGPVDSADKMLEVEGMIAATAEKFEMPDVYTYLRNAEERYSSMKTLLYNDQPKPFYSFYICNRIRCREVGGRIGRHPHNMQILNDATVEKIREVSRFVIIMGTGGLGKSMMMRHLMLDAITNFDDLKRFPVFIPLKDFDETASSLFDYVYSKISVFDSNLKIDQFEEMIANGACLLLLDGLDEIGAGSARRFERELEKLTDKYSNNMFILSSRPFQAFVSYERFSLLRLMPFDRRQAMQLINRLEFRPDEPAIKEKFQAALEKTLFRTHRSFTENPLLLTIMLLTFEQYAEVPSKMHIFYREAFEVLAKRHDASKGAYKRALKTGLSVDTLSDYFAELCFRSYKDEKFELTAEEFTGYFNALNARATVNDKKTTASDFLEDLCSNLCLLYFEGNSYHFTHRSFQEYFCALFFSKQKDKFIAKLGDFFEKHRRRMYGDRTFYMLYDMATEKVEEYIFLPFLSSLFDKCEKADGYWTFLEEMHPQITYSSEDEYLFPRRVVESRSFLLNAVLDIIGFNERGRLGRDIITITELPYYEELEIEKIPHYRQRTLFDSKHEEYDIEEVEDEEAGYVCRFVVAEVRQRPDDFEDLLNALNDDKFVLKKQYYAAQECMKELIAKQKNEDDSLLDLL